MAQLAPVEQDFTSQTLLLFSNDFSLPAPTPWNVIHFSLILSRHVSLQWHLCTLRHQKRKSYQKKHTETCLAVGISIVASGNSGAGFCPGVTALAVPWPRWSPCTADCGCFSIRSVKVSSQQLRVAGKRAGVHAGGACPHACLLCASTNSYAYSRTKIQTYAWPT